MYDTEEKDVKIYIPGSSADSGHSLPPHSEQRP